MSEVPRYILAPHVPTAPDVVTRMIQLAQVGPGDVVYDFGCGDGRLAIAAALCGASSVGVDLEAHWVDASRRNAEAAGVTHLARFERGDALVVDVRRSTVVFLYLVHWSTRLVAQHLRERCAAGTRVVSNGFPFDPSWRTVTESFVDDSGQPRSIHLWVVED